MAGCQMIPFPKTENNDMPAKILTEGASASSCAEYP